MKRRDFLKVLASVAVWPPCSREACRKPIIGFLSSRSRNDSGRTLAGFCKGLAEAGYTDGLNVEIDYRWADGDYEKLPALAADIVKQNLTVLIAAGGEPSAMAAKAASAGIPIVFSVGGDPIKSGLVSSLNRPGGNMTGVTFLATELEAKRLSLLHEIAPRAKRIGVLIDGNFEQAPMQIEEVTQAAREIRRSAAIVHASTDDELIEAFDRLRTARADALLVCSAPFFDTRRQRIITYEKQRRIPAIYQFRDYPAQGGLMSYGICSPDGYRQIGLYAGAILRGTPPSELPVVQPTTFEFVINLSTAAATGIEIPGGLLARADDVIS